MLPKYHTNSVRNAGENSSGFAASHPPHDFIEFVEFAAFDFLRIERGRVRSVTDLYRNGVLVGRLRRSREFVQKRQRCRQSDFFLHLSGGGFFVGFACASRWPGCGGCIAERILILSWRIGDESSSFGPLN